MTFVMAWPLAATIDWKCVEGALWYWLKPSYILQICLSAAGSAWFSPSDTKLTRMTFTWGESVGRQDLLLCPGPCYGSTSLDMLYTLHMTLCDMRAYRKHVEQNILQGKLISVKSRHVLVRMARPWTGMLLRSDTSHSSSLDSGRAWICRWKVHTS